MLVLQACAPDQPVGSAASPVIAGLAHSGLEPRVRGLVLLGELGCVACHAAGSNFPSMDARSGPDLTRVGQRVLGDYLPYFLADPSGVDPGTTMPDPLRDLAPADRVEAAAALAKYLQSFTTDVAAPEQPDADAALRGRSLFHEAGCVACHAPRAPDGSELAMAGSEPLGDLTKKYTLPGLRTFLLAPHDVRPAARMPDLHLAPGEAQDLTSFLLAGATHAPAAAPRGDDQAAAQIAAGRALFAEHNCAQCHQLEDPQRAPARSAKPLDQVNAERGCMSGETGPWPFYALSQEQRADIAAALRARNEPLTDEQKIRQRLASRNCLACHERGAFGGIPPERNAFFTSNDEGLGPESRLPPPLTGVGAKLQHDWLVDCVAYGQEIRPYLRTRMPGFGPAFADELAALLARTDTLPPLELAALPDDAEQAEVLIQLGRELAGDRGMGCIQCHAFAGERVGMLAGIDLVDSTAQRLRREWFTHFLHAPSQFRSGTLMPQFFLDGQSTRPELGDGSAAQHVDALWLYLAQGRNVRQPSGMRHEAMPLAVGNEAVILRRSVQNTGKRGISVGYPGGVNLTFDAENLGLNQIWWGKFVDAAGVWTGQGSGAARILGEEIVKLPNGPAFVALANPTDPWPTASRRELGQTFLGYDLDAEQRPTFRYVCENVTISDAPREMPGDSAAHPRLRRTFAFASASDLTLQFRAALAEHVADLGDGVVQVGSVLRIHLPPDSYRIRAAGAERELLIEIPIRQGQTTLVIDYAWLQDSQ